MLEGDPNLKLNSCSMTSLFLPMLPLKKCYLNILAYDPLQAS